MTNYLNTGESGVTNGTTATSVNTGAGSAGTAFTPVTANTGTVTFDNGHVHRATYSYKFACPVANDVARGDSITFVASNTAAVQGWFYQTAYPTVDLTIYLVKAGSAIVASLVQLTDGRLRLFDATTPTAALWTSTASMPLNALWRPSLGAILAATPTTPTTTNGTLHAGYYVGANLDTSTLSGSGADQYDSTTANLGTAQFTGVRWGKITSAGVWTVWIDDPQYSDSSGAHMAPVGAAVPVIAYTATSIRRLNTSGTSGSPTGRTLVQASGPTTGVTITGPDASGIFEITLPDPLTSTLTFTLGASNGSGSATPVTYTASPTGGGTAAIRDYAVMGADGLLH